MCGISFYIQVDNSKRRNKMYPDNDCADPDMLAELQKTNELLSIIARGILNIADIKDYNYVRKAQTQKEAWSNIHEVARFAKPDEMETL